MHEGAEVPFSRQAGRERLCRCWELALSELKCRLQLAGNCGAACRPVACKGSAGVPPHGACSQSAGELGKSHAKGKTQPQPEKKMWKTRAGFWLTSRELFPASSGAQPLQHGPYGLVLSLFWAVLAWTLVLIIIFTLNVSVMWVKRRRAPWPTAWAQMRTISTLILRYSVCSNLAVPTPHFRCPMQEWGMQQAAFPMLLKASAPTQCAERCRVPLGAGPLPESTAGSEALHQHTWEMGLRDHEIQPSAGAQRESPLWDDAFIPPSLSFAHLLPAWGMWDAGWRVRDVGRRSTAVRAEPPLVSHSHDCSHSPLGQLHHTAGGNKGPSSAMPLLEGKQRSLH